MQGGLMSIHHNVSKWIISAFVAGLMIAASTSQAFEVFDATLYKGKPSLARHGIKPMTVIYAQHVWGPKDNRKELPKLNAVLNRLVKIPSSHEIVVLDFEQWPLQGYRHRPWIYSESIKKLENTFELFKRHRPSIQFGFFAQIPVCHFSRAILPLEHPDHVIWQTDVRRVKPLAEKVDVIFPSAYTYTDNRAEWAKFIEVSLKEAKKIFHGKVYPFIWPQFFNRPPTPPNLRAQYMDAEFWRYQLETIYRHADGVVIWGGWDFEKTKAAVWKEDASWWHATKLFLEQKGLAADTVTFN
jgi:hypothetical protein